MTEGTTKPAPEPCAARGRGCGTPSGWFNRGRCVRCRKAHNQHSRASRGLTTKQRDEVLSALRSGLSAQEAAAGVGKTARSLQAASVRDGELRAALDGESEAQQQIARRGDLLMAMIRNGGNRDEATREIGEKKSTVMHWAKDPLYAAAEEAVVQWLVGASGRQGRKNRVTAAALDKAAQVIEDGGTIEEAAGVVGFSSVTLNKYRNTHERLNAALNGRSARRARLQRPPAPPPAERRKADPAALDEVARLISDGVPIVAAAQAVGVRYGTLRRHRDKHAPLGAAWDRAEARRAEPQPKSAPVRRRGPTVTPDMDQQIHEWWPDASLSLEDIGGRLGVTKWTVTRAARRLELPNRQALLRSQAAPED